MGLNAFDIYPTKRNASNIRKSTCDRPLWFISVQRYIRYCCVTHLLQSGVKMFKRKFVVNQVGVIACKVTENKRFITLFCRISSSNGNRISKQNCTKTPILCKFYQALNS